MSIAAHRLRNVNRNGEACMALPLAREWCLTAILLELYCWLDDELNV